MELGKINVMKGAEDFFDIFYRVHSYLDEYIELHNVLFSCTIFQKINFEELKNRSQNIATKMSQSSIQLNFLSFESKVLSMLCFDFKEYTQFLYDTMNNLINIFSLLEKFSKQKYSFFRMPINWWSYRKLLKLYNHSREKYTKKGRLINKMYEMLKNQK